MENLEVRSRSFGAVFYLQVAPRVSGRQDRSAG
ncbi:MAG: hypothetical protein QOI53_4015, partial [Verrucomicrobiota bacterium]|nr:hypothetical protein [Verrucomicrobiota bacterium]